MERAPAAGNAADAQIPSQLRQRMLSRAATFAEGTQPSPTRLLRRRSSVLSDLSDTRHSTRSSTDNLLRNTDAFDKVTSLEEGPHWLSSPVIFAIFPAVAGLLYQNGAAVLTDFFTLALAAWLLHWCCTWPWTWYHSAQQRRYVDPEEALFDDTLYEEEDEDSIIESNENPDPTRSDTKGTGRLAEPTATAAQLGASQALKRQERMAFVTCFTAPLVGAYLLHIIRGQLRVAEGLVSDFNLNLFVMVAEVRPIMCLMKMQQERMFHLQRIVKTDPQDLINPHNAQAIVQRLATLEGRLDDPAANSHLESARIAAEVRDGLQTQLDSIVRAIRKYEKKSVAQTMQIEARFQEVDVRLKDTLSLAAAAARTGQRPGLISSFLGWTVNTVNSVLQTMWDMALYPLRTALAVVVEMKSYLVKDEDRQSRRRVRGQTNGHTSMSTSRMQSKGIR
ncbi:uncharacterized protein M421DRAFT_52347 [Didymella exigua CBS 183.55]|uniref:Uncharacterized protein n=1 Tax=Didymella exigua CBS 183.55 TaxID=1150837 RepID=A0A6A5RXY0_9PLEO|nr:uncharacterized protein M421DRAFT_52347 [Didymella exigua CBS 183.55]KAF1933355.1 hypothetical protein M421DRAFT_52347 [Didymella exigua CBS 183.55]